MALVAWWEDLRVDSKNVLYHLITGTDAAALITEWKDLQCRYQMYNKEVSLIVQCTPVLDKYLPYHRLRYNKIITSRNCNTHSLVAGFFRGSRNEDR